MNRQATKAGCTFLKDVMDIIDRFTMGDIMSGEELEIIKYHLDLAAGEMGQDDNASGEDEIKEFQQHKHPIVS